MKIKQIIQQIQNTLENQGKYFYYLLLIDDTVKLIASGNDLENLRERVFLKLASKKYTRECFLYYVTVCVKEKYIKEIHDRRIVIVSLGGIRALRILASSKLESPETFRALNIMKLNA